MKVISCYINITVLLWMYCGDVETKTTSRLDINPIALGWFPPFRYGQGILTDIPHPLILSNIIGRWGGYVARETRTSVRYFLGAIPLPYLLKITSIPTNTTPTHHQQIA